MGFFVNLITILYIIIVIIRGLPNEGEMGDI